MNSKLALSLIALTLFRVGACAQTNRFPPINWFAGDPTGNVCTMDSPMLQSQTTGYVYGCSPITLKYQQITAATGGTWPGYPASGVVASTGGAWRTPSFSDVVSLWASGGCIGVLNSDGTCSAPPAHYVDQFSGATLAEKWNACNTAVIAAGGGTCDARNMGGTQYPTANVELAVGTPTQGLSGGVTFILPTSGQWWFAGTDPTKCGIHQYFGSTLIGFNMGASPVMNLYSTSAANMDSLYCTDTGSGTGSQVELRAEGFGAGNSTGTMAHGVFDIRNLVDQASFAYMSGANATGEVWHIDETTAGRNCCGVSFNHVSAGESGQQGGYPLHILSGVGPMKFTNSTFNGPPSGKNNILIDSGVQDVSFDSVYGEKYINTGAPMVKVSTNTYNISFNNTWMHSGTPESGQVCWENDGTQGPFAVTNSYCSPTTGFEAINDVGFARTYGSGDGFVPNYVSTVSYRPNYFGFLRTDDLTAPYIYGLDAIYPANSAIPIGINGAIEPVAQASGQFSADFLAFDNLPQYPNVLFAAPFPYVTTPTGTPSTSGGTVAASTTNVAWITCTIPYSIGTTPAILPSLNVTTTGSTSSIAWAWTAPTACTQYGTPSYKIWVANSGTPTHYFTSATNSYTQTAPASSGTSGTMPTAPDYAAAQVNDDGSVVIDGWSPTSQGTYNAATNPIPTCDAGNYLRATEWVSDATSEFGTYASGGTWTIPVSCVKNTTGPAYAWTSLVSNSAPVLTRIAQVVVGSGVVGPITFSGIPQTFTNLMVVVSGTCSPGGGPDHITVNFNGDTTSSDYRYTGFYNDATVMHVDNVVDAATYLVAGYLPCGALFGAVTLTIPSYTNATYLKTMLSSSTANTSSSYILNAQYSGYWVGTDAITTILLTDLEGNEFGDNTVATLYGY